MSEIEERFLRLPDSEDYTRVRQFNIDKKGAVVSRGDSFRRKKNNKGLLLFLKYEVTKFSKDIDIFSRF